MFYFRKILLLALIPVALLGAWYFGDFSDAPALRNNLVGIEIPVTAASESARVSDEKKSAVTLADSRQTKSDESGFVAPMDQAEKRITRKTFGMYITPENSPVQPDKFRGFHAGTDWEVFPDELAGDVPVRAVCSGNLKLKKTASGYGGVAVQQCDLDGQEITVIYGHMKLSSITTETGGFVSAGKVLGLLGDDKSPETDGARKHLHLAFHLGGKIDIKGYLAENKDLENWLDPCDYICK